MRNVASKERIEKNNECVLFSRMKEDRNSRVRVGEREREKAREEKSMGGRILQGRGRARIMWKDGLAKIYLPWPVRRLDNFPVEWLDGWQPGDTHSLMDMAMAVPT